ncbi:MAG: YicC family protein [Treponema sp.]|jgi:uncharacterized protein (TIGR00255 family)|nr:YicC family protein [Treponema sp.]
MTGYARATRQDGGLACTLEIKGYNHRFLDIQVFTHPPLPALEPDIRGYMAKRFSRGKIEVSIKIKDCDAPIAVAINREAARSYREAASRLAEECDLDEKPSLALLFGMAGVLEIETTRDEARYWGIIEPALYTAADQFEAERVREGRRTGEDIRAYIDILERMKEKISVQAPLLEASLQEHIRGRFAEVLGDAVDETRVLTETAALLMKYTIGEELCRLGAHLEEFREEGAGNAAAGKKLDFLCQEINREINTIGSKTPQLEVSRAVVAMKEALENIREQLRNVE